MPIPKMVFKPWCSNCQCLSMEMMDQEFHAWSNTLFFHLIPLQGRVRCRHGQMRIKIQKSRVSRVSLVMRGTWMCYRTNKRQWTPYILSKLLPWKSILGGLYLLLKSHNLNIIWSIHIGAKLAVAPVARATPLFLPRPEIIYINVLHFSAPPRTYLVSATPLFRPLWRHWKLASFFGPAWWKWLVLLSVFIRVFLVSKKNTWGGNANKMK